MSEAEDPTLLQRNPREVTVEDVRRLMGASTPHFALQLRNRIRRLIEDLPPDHPARLEGERAIQELERIASTGQVFGPVQKYELPLPSLRLETGTGTD